MPIRHSTSSAPQSASIAILGTLIAALSMALSTSVAAQELSEDAEESFPGKGRLKASDEAMRKLERENRRLRQENEFLKKTAVLFAKNQP